MRTLEYDEAQRALILIDQTRLPRETSFVACRTLEDVAHAISTLQVRGAPAIGVAAAYGMALAASSHVSDDPSQFVAGLEQAAANLRRARPTAVNLQWGVDRALAHGRAVAETEGVPAAKEAL